MDVTGFKQTSPVNFLHKEFYTQWCTYCTRSFRVKNAEESSSSHQQLKRNWDKKGTLQATLSLSICESSVLCENEQCIVPCAVTWKTTELLKVMRKLQFIGVKTWRPGPPAVQCNVNFNQQDTWIPNKSFIRRISLHNYSLSRHNTNLKVQGTYR